MHIENEELVQFQKGDLDSVRMVELLEHIANCDYCADKLINMESQELMPAPVYLKDQMIKRTQMLDVKAEIHIKTTSKQVQLLLYGLKTTAAVLGALLLLFSVGQIRTAGNIEDVNHVEVTTSLGNQLNEKSNFVADIMNQYSNQIINGGFNK